MMNIRRRHFDRFFPISSLPQHYSEIRGYAWWNEQNASKLAIFLEYENPGFSNCNYWFFLGQNQKRRLKKNQTQRNLLPPLEQICLQWKVDQEIQIMKKSIPKLRVMMIFSRKNQLLLPVELPIYIQNLNEDIDSNWIRILQRFLLQPLMLRYGKICFLKNVFLTFFSTWCRKIRAKSLVFSCIRVKIVIFYTEMTRKVVL